MNVLVVGAGEMGTWLGETLAAELDAPDLVFADTREDAAAAAADALGGRAVQTGTDERFDVVCLAVPIPALEAAVEEWADAADRAVVDVTGVMAPAVAAMRSAAPTVERVSLHPLFAPDAAPGTVAVVPDAPGPVTDRLRRTLSAAGNDLFETTAAEHDEAMVTVQARVHAAVLAFGLAAEDVPEEFHTPVSTAMFGLLDRVTGNDPRVYADIQAAFDGAGDVADAAADLAEADDESFAAFYRAAARDGDRGTEPR
jgi:prephenate dehydrogenase